MTVDLRKVGLTTGATASLISRRTFQLAAQVLARERPEGMVSLEYGSGGSKRQRQIEAAAVCLRVSRETIHPTIQRPFYAMSVIENPPSVVLLNEKPVWLIDPRISSSKYCAEAVDLWRQKWLTRARTRIEKKWGFGQIPGLARILGEGGREWSSD
jgi:hypothetical protein